MKSAFTAIVNTILIISMVLLFKGVISPYLFAGLLILQGIIQSTITLYKSYKADSSNIKTLSFIGRVVYIAVLLIVVYNSFILALGLLILQSVIHLTITLYESYKADSSNVKTFSFVGRVVYTAVLLIVVYNSFILAFAGQGTCIC